MVKGNLTDCGLLVYMVKGGLTDCGLLVYMVKGHLTGCSQHWCHFLASFLLHS